MVKKLDRIETFIYDYIYLLTIYNYILIIIINPTISCLLMFRTHWRVNIAKYIELYHDRERKKEHVRS